MTRRTIMGQDGLGERLRTALKAAGMTQRGLAEAVGVSEQTVGNWVAGRDEPRARHLKAVATALDADRAWLLTGARGLDESAVLAELRAIRLAQQELLAEVLELQRQVVADRRTNNAPPLCE